MMKKICLGMLFVVILGGVAVSGYEFGQYLAKHKATEQAVAKK